MRQTLARHIEALTRRIHALLLHLLALTRLHPPPLVIGAGGFRAGLLYALLRLLHFRLSLQPLHLPALLLLLAAGCLLLALRGRLSVLLFDASALGIGPRTVLLPKLLLLALQAIPLGLLLLLHLTGAILLKLTPRRLVALLRLLLLHLLALPLLGRLPLLLLALPLTALLLLLGLPFLLLLVGLLPLKVRPGALVLLLSLLLRLPLFSLVALILLLLLRFQPAPLRLIAFILLALLNFLAASLGLLALILLTLLRFLLLPPVIVAGRGRR